MDKFKFLVLIKKLFLDFLINLIFLICPRHLFDLRKNQLDY
jgi:hypothetical protein